MRRGSAKGGSPAKKQRGKKAAPARSTAPKKATGKAPEPARRRSAAKTKSEQATLARELNEALQRQAATAEILKIIASSPSEVQPVFQAIADRANRLINGHATTVFRVVGDTIDLAAFTPVSAEADAVLKASFPMPIAGRLQNEKMYRGEIVEITDTESGAYSHLTSRSIARARGFRSRIMVPLRSATGTIGGISVTRKELGAFAKGDIELLLTFADQAVIAIQNARQFNDTREALERQTATADILKVIASSPDNVQPVFEAIAERSNRLVDGLSTAVLSLTDDVLHLMAYTGISPAADAALKAFYPQPLSAFSWGEPILKGEIVRVPDTEDEAAIPPAAKELARLRGWRSLLLVPLLRDQKPIGLISVTRVQPGPFPDHHVQLLQTFADQAVIAIGNVRLFDEVQARTRDLSESLQQQTATADVLKVISRSAFDLGAVLQTLVKSAAKLCNATVASIWLRDGEVLRAHASVGMSEQFREFLDQKPIGRDKGKVIGRTFLTGEIVHVPDVLADPEYTFVESPRIGAFRAALGAPLVREGRVEGVFGLTRAEPGPFSDREIELVRTFADQALIAIENVRLFNETQQALERQTATADVLKVIASSPSNLQPVFDAIAERSNELMHGHSTTVFRFVGELVELAAMTSVSEQADAMLRARFPMPIAGNAVFATVHRGEISEMRDTESPDYAHKMDPAVARARGFRSRMIVPLKSDSGVIGAISVTRKEPGAFARKDIELLQTFADQAVIAISNVELFNEVQTRTRDLSESLQQQTATADVLKVISRSAFDLQAVLGTLVESAARLCEADEGIIMQPKGDGFGLAANWGLTPVKEQFLQTVVFRPADGSMTGRVLTKGSVIHIRDVLEEPDFIVAGDPDPARTRLCVPLLRNGVPIGVFVLTRLQVRPFADRQIELVQTFADQAVIALENARLFNETQEALERQTATAEILKVIASSPDDVQPVFEAIAERSKRIVDGRATAVCSLVDNVVHLMAFTPTNAEADARMLALFPRPLSQMRWGEAIGRGKMFQTADMDGPSVPQDVRDLARLGGHRSQLVVPLLSEGKPIGAIAVTRAAADKFPDHHIQLLQTFADQAVIAISNVELFQEVQQRTRDLSQSLDDLRTAQDRLVQTEKLASLGQLTAGIAHEIKNPLNFVNNFSALSAELTGELNDLLKDAALTDKMRAEVEELTQLLRDNLDKVVQHGKRADSIVKNMLLHSREGKGEQRSADINALVDESLNLAYHGARAEKSGFNITLQRDFDAGAGAAELFPQEITRALLNLISNGFYAATKRKADNGDQEFEPLVVATTKDLGTTVEIRIRDNGTGIPPEVKEKMFNPFFTTKPAGEGTGLGLSMTHDIIVKQHGGRIDVATAPGQFTEFTIVLPRANGPGGRART